MNNPGVRTYAHHLARASPQHISYIIVNGEIILKLSLDMLLNSKGVNQYFKKPIPRESASKWLESRQKQLNNIKHGYRKRFQVIKLQSLPNSKRSTRATLFENRQRSKITTIHLNTSLNIQVSSNVEPKSSSILHFSL